jgi:hypothetical protein
MGDKTERELDKEALMRIFTKEQEYCEELMRETFLRGTPQAHLMQERLLKGVFRTARLNEKATRMRDHLALEHVFTADREYCMAMVRGLFVGEKEDERAKLMTHRLLQAVFECRPELPHVESMPRMERMRYYMEKIEWETESCRLYAEAARQVSANGNRNALVEHWETWKIALGEEENGEEFDRPTTVDGMLRELLAIMDPDVDSFPWRGDSVQERRMNYREYMRERPKNRGVCCACAGLPGALDLLGPLLGADRVDTQDRRGQRPY